MTEKEQFCEKMKQSNMGAYCPYTGMNVMPDWCRTACKDSGDVKIKTIIEKPRRIKGCCGKVVNIARGYIRSISDYLGITTPSTFAIKRRRICGQCDEQTWMSRMEYILWLKSQGVKVLTHLSMLEKLPPLSKQERDEKRQIAFCRLCKCSIVWKAPVKSEKCPLDKWGLVP